MLDTDIYVQHKSTDATTALAVINDVSERFSCQPHDLRETILILAAQCVYITYTEFYSAYPVVASTVPVAFKKLLDNGYLKKGNFDSPEGPSKTYYTITPTGYAIANSLCKHPLSSRYKYGRKDTAIVHTYSAGLNMFQMICADIPFRWDREVILNDVINHMQNSAKGELQVDAECTVFPASKNERSYYFEQDMGYERESVLTDKLSRYYELGLMSSPNNVILFSFRIKGRHIESPSRYAQISPYSQKELRALIAQMETDKSDNAYDYIREPFAQVFLSEVGAARADGSRGKVKADLAFVKQFYSSLVLRSNPYMLKFINKSFEDMASGRLHNIGSTLIKWANDLPGWAYPLMSGAQVDFLATPLVADNIGWTMLDTQPTLQDNLIASLSYLYDGLKYTGISPDIPIDGGWNIKLRNAFAYKIKGDYKGIVCVEFPWMDLGAWLRAFLFLHQYHGQTPIHLINVFINKAEQLAFYETIRYAYPEVCVLLDKTSSFCLMQYDIGRTDRVYAVTDVFTFSNRVYMHESMLTAELEEG